MLKSRNLRIVLSLVLAVILWAYVVGSVETTTSKLLKSVPITLSHTAELAERGLAVSSMETETIDLEVSGSRVAISELSANDITALVDMASASKGTNELNITVRVPSGIVVKDRSAAKTAVTVENMSQRMVNVEVTFDGAFADGESAVIDSISPATISVSGGETQVDKVASVVAPVETTRLTNKLEEVQAQLQPVDKDGKPVDKVTLSQETVSVSGILSVTKAVPIEANIVDHSSDDLVRDVVLPKEALITGRSDVLDGIETLKAKDVIVTTITESKEVALQFDLPEGVAFADEEASFVAQVAVSEMETKELIYGVNDIELRHAAGQLDYTLDEDTEVLVIVKDSEEVLKNITKDNIKVYLDLNDIGGGTSSVEVLTETAEEIHSVIVDPETITVTAKNTEGADNDATNN